MCLCHRDDDVAVGWEYSPPYVTCESLTWCSWHPYAGVLHADVECATSRTDQREGHRSKTERTGGQSVDGVDGHGREEHNESPFSGIEDPGLLLTPRPDVEGQAHQVEDSRVQEVHQTGGIEQSQAVHRAQNADDKIEVLDPRSVFDGDEDLEQGGQEIGQQDEG